MAPLDIVKQLTRRGLFGQALVTLEATQPRAADRKAADSLHAYLLLMVGRVEEAQRNARALLLSQKKAEIDHSLCEWVIGQVLLEEGAIDSAIERPPEVR